jgi:hypothetical protein
MSTTKFRFQPNWYEKQTSSESDAAPSNPPISSHLMSGHPMSSPLTKSFSPPKGVWDIIAGTYTRTAPEKQSDKIFHLFPNLPKELRREIWLLSLPSSRIVEVFWDEAKNECWSVAPLPTALSVNQEARGVALEHYELLFSTRGESKKIYFNTEVDELYLGLGNIVSTTSSDPCVAFLKAIGSEDCGKIGNLTLDDDFAENYAREKGLWPLSNLRSMTIAAHYGNDDIVVFREVNSQGLSDDNTSTLDYWQFGEDGHIELWGQDKFAESGNTWEYEVDCKRSGIMTSGRHPRLAVSRNVAKYRLKKDPKWAKRMRFLLEETMVDWTGCLRLQDGVFDRLIQMERMDIRKYYEMGVLLAEKMGKGLEGLDPLMVYAIQNPCVCPVGHKKQQYRLKEEYCGMLKLDLLEALIEVDSREFIRNLLNSLQLQPGVN